MHACLALAYTIAHAKQRRECMHDDVHAAPKADAQGVCAALHVSWLHPVFGKEALQAAFERFGAVKHVQICLGPAYAPKTVGRLVDYYNYTIVKYRDKCSPARRRRARR